MRQLIKPVLSDFAVAFLEMFCIPVISNDFMGYLVNLEPQLKITMVIYPDGRYGYVSNDGKELSERKLKKIRKFLYKQGFLREGFFDPFLETESYTKIHIDLEHADYINGNIFMENVEYENKGKNQ